MTKLRVGVIYGGRSGEHEVSVTSAASIFRHIDRARYEPVPIRIEKDGRWMLADREPEALSAAEVIRQARVGEPGLVTGGAATDVDQTTLGRLGLDVVFPVLHGPYGEDGTVQGLFELADVPYVGSGVLGSAAGMDKAMMKLIFGGSGLPQVAWQGFIRTDWERDRPRVLAEAATLGLPAFVKPANLGSSLGISKVKTPTELSPAIELAFEFDRRVVVEAGVVHAREIECAVLGNEDPHTSVPGEIIPSREFYDYEAKYLDEGSRCVIPADLTAPQVAEVQRLSIRAFRAIDAAGLSRVDFLMSGDTGELFVNEINTMPGFTTISMYSKMWEASGVPYATLVDRLIQLALARHSDKQRLRTSAP